MFFSFNYLNLSVIHNKLNVSSSNSLHFILASGLFTWQVCIEVHIIQIMAIAIIQFISGLTCLADCYLLQSCQEHKLHFIRELMGTFFSSKFWNASTCPPLNQSSKTLSYTFALITLASSWLWSHQGHLDAFASFRRLFSCPIHICTSAFPVLNRMHERPIKNYQKENLKQSFLDDDYRNSRGRRLSFPNPLKRNDDIFLKEMAQNAGYCQSTIFPVSVLFWQFKCNKC